MCSSACSAFRTLLTSWGESSRSRLFSLLNALSFLSFALAGVTLTRDRMRLALRVPGTIKLSPPVGAGAPPCTAFGRAFGSDARVPVLGSWGIRYEGGVAW